MHTYCEALAPWLWCSIAMGPLNVLWPCDWHACTHACARQAKNAARAVELAFQSADPAPWDKQEAALDFAATSNVNAGNTARGFRFFQELFKGRHRLPVNTKCWAAADAAGFDADMGADAAGSDADTGAGQQPLPGVCPGLGFPLAPRLAHASLACVTCFSCSNCCISVCPLVCTTLHPFALHLCMDHQR